VQEKRVVQGGTRLSRGGLCRCSHPIAKSRSNIKGSRTYGNEGEDIREGFEPNGSSAVVDPKEQDDQGFAIDEDDHDGESPGAEESRAWKKEVEPEVSLKPKYGVEGEEFENVWGGDGPSEPPKENP
jgi:hypothetical protein